MFALTKTVLVAPYFDTLGIREGQDRNWAGQANISTAIACILLVVHQH